MARYGYNHRRLRAALLPSAYGQPCHLCGQTMKWGEDLDLDHTADRLAYRGFAHSACNRSEGGRRGNAKQRKRRGGVFG